MFGHSSSQTFRSNSTEYSTHAELIHGLMAKLLDDGKWQRVHFGAENCHHFVEIADNDDSLLINLSYSFAEPLEEKLREVAIELPETWQISAFRNRGWLTAGYAEITVSRGDVVIASDFCADIFQRLFQVAGSDPIKGWLEK